MKAKSIAKSILAFVMSIIILTLIVFCISRLAPGDPLVAYFGDRAEKLTQAERAAAIARLGLDQPLYIQFIDWLKGALRGDFGISYKYKTDVLELIKGRIGNTLLLSGVGYLIIFAGSFLSGIFCAWHEDRAADKLICRIGTFFSCIPEFWLSLLLILIFAVKLGILPSSGAYTIGGARDTADRLRHLILPLTAVVISHLWYYAYIVRNRLAEELRADYVLAVRAKGLTKKQIILRHCIRNIFPSYLSLMAAALPHILGGSYIIETVFSYPGLGSLIYESARYKDYNTLMVLCIMTGVTVIICSKAAELIGAALDPRLRNRGQTVIYEEADSL